MTQKLTPAELKRQKIASWGFMIFGSLILAIGIFVAFKANISRTWPVAEGKVQYILVRQATSARTISRAIPNKEYYGQVHYTYAVDGKVYKGNLYSFGDGKRATSFYKEQEKARAIAHELFPLRSKVKIYYNPDAPEEAVLKPGANWGSYWAVIVGVLVFALGVHSVYASRKNAIMAEEDKSM